MRRGEEQWAQPGEESWRNCRAGANGWEWVLGFSISFFLSVSCLSHPNPEERVPIWPIRQSLKIGYSSTVQGRGERRLKWMTGSSRHPSHVMWGVWLFRSKAVDFTLGCTIILDSNSWRARG